jgi:DNA-binding IclR family transcriptional regulator
MSEEGKIALSVALMLVVTCCGSAALAAQPSARAYAQLDQPPARDKPALTADEVSKLKKDLAGARDRQKSHTKAKDAAPPPASKKP